MTLLRLPREKIMRQQQMLRLISSFPQLAHRQRQQLASCLQVLMDRRQATAVVEMVRNASRACPHCTITLRVKNEWLLRTARRRGGKALAGCKGSEYTPVLMARDHAGATANFHLADEQSGQRASRTQTFAGA